MQMTIFNSITKSALKSFNRYAYLFIIFFGSLKANVRGDGLSHPMFIADWLLISGLLTEPVTSFGIVSKF